MTDRHHDPTKLNRMVHIIGTSGILSVILLTVSFALLASWGFYEAKTPEIVYNCQKR